MGLVESLQSIRLASCDNAHSGQKRDRRSESQAPSGFQLTGRRRGSREKRKTNNKIKKESELVSSIGDQVESGEEGNERTRGLGDGGRAKTTSGESDAVAADVG